MRIIQRSEIDIEKWNALVKKKSAYFHSYSWWLDVMAEDWCALIEDDYSVGIALPFRRQLGIKTLYTPIFSEYPEFLGKVKDRDLVVQLILEQFQIIETGFSDPIFDNKYLSHETQIIKSDPIYNKHAMRMLNKARKAGIIVRESTDSAAILSFVRSELIGIVDSINKVTIDRLERGIHELVKRGFIEGFEIFHKEERSGGLIFVETENRIYYMKGAATKDCKNEGGIYLAMDLAIQNSIAKNKIFDFGGSRVEGVKRFNQGLGGVDIFRPYYSIDHSPFWYKMMKKVRNAIQRK